MQRKIGYACTPVTIPYRTSRSFIMKNFNEEKFYNIVEENLDDLYKILHWNYEHEIYMFRISSDIIPFGSHEINNIKWWIHFKDKLYEIGKYIVTNNIRVSMHPGQYSVLNSPKNNIATRAISDIEYHCRFLDSLNIDYTHKIVLHVGGVYEDKFASIERFISNFNRLSMSAKKRLILENDEKNYNLEEVLSICKQINIPCVFDNLHHEINRSSLSLNVLMSNVKATWKKEDGNMKIHYSDEDTLKRSGAHAIFINSETFLWWYNFLQPYNADMMLEIKDKELSAIKAINLIKYENKLSLKYEVWNKYKYLVLEKNIDLYNQCEILSRHYGSIMELYKLIETALSLPYNEISFKDSIKELWVILNPHCTIKEKRNFNILLEESNLNIIKLKTYLKKLCVKYKIEKLLTTYYFFY